MTGQLSLVAYRPEFDDACLALDRLCKQGKSFSVSFRRPSFRARSELYDKWHIVVALREEACVGVAAWAERDLELHGQKVRGAFIFDVRVHPLHQRSGIGRSLGDEVHRQTAAAGVDLEYGYCVADNRAAIAVTRLLGCTPLGGYRHLVWPAYRRRLAVGQIETTSIRDIHRAHCQQEGPFDFYSDVTQGGQLKGHVMSLRSEDAGCSIWSNAALMQEVVEHLPLHLRTLRRLTKSWPLSLASWPNIPAPRDPIRSWFVFDFYAGTERSAVDLMAHVNNAALEAGIDYCYVIARTDATWIDAVRALNPRIFSPVFDYRLLATSTSGPLAPTPRVYVDIRDL